MKSKFFIIIPIYNIGSEFIDKCLLSICQQKIVDNLYIIIINDKSPKWNEEKKIIEQYRGKINIVIIENKNNIGLGSSRNEGIKFIKNNINYSCYDYILFLDSDDFYKRNSLKKLYRKIVKNNNPDIIRFSYILLDKQKIYVNYKPVVFVGNRSNKKIWNGFLECSCFSAYNAKYIIDNNLFFINTKKIHEDVYYSLVTSCLANSITSTNFYVYVYRWNRPGSITSIYNNNSLTEMTKIKWIKDVTFFIKEAYNFVINKSEKEKISFYFSKFNWILKCWKLNNLSTDLYAEEIKILKKIYISLKCNFYDENHIYITHDSLEGKYQNQKNNNWNCIFIKIKTIVFNMLFKLNFVKKYLVN